MQLKFLRGFFHLHPVFLFVTECGNKLIPFNLADHLQPSAALANYLINRYITLQALGIHDKTRAWQLLMQRERI